ncbi:MAG TPA: sigma-70 family RNA polymerase sigma factor [Gammaproteobacteria bacterium]|nr:sigma-70 family RNA polymerase sigma factor [Gammaproteobacteria bacterium]
MKAKIPSLGGRRRFEQVAGELRQDLFRYALWLSRDATAAEDIVQESLLRAWRGFDGLQDEAKARQWLVTIVRREFLRFRERQREESVDPAMLEEIAEDGADPLVQELRVAIFALEENYREPLALQVLMGHTTDEIAAILGLTQGAVLTRLHRARDKLKRALVEDGTLDPANV